MTEFKVGDAIVHVSHGPGQIINIVHKKMSGLDEQRYYEITTAKSSVWVPIDDKAPHTLRLLTPMTELKTYEAILQSQPETLPKDYRLRQAALQTRLKTNSLKTVCEVLRDLTAHGWPKPLSDVENVLVRRLRENISQEWALVRQISHHDANQQIENLLLENKKKLAKKTL